MKLSTRSRYGLRAIMELVVNYSNEPISLKCIARRQGISENYLEQLMAVLKKSGIVKSVRGVYGGYLLARKPSEITVGDVIRALEGPIGLVDCVLEQDSVECSKSENCITRIVWKKINQSIIETIDSITLQQIREEATKNDNGSIC